MLGYFSADIICSLLGTDNVQGQISEHIFAPNGGYCLYYPSFVFCNARSFENWGIYKKIASIWRENMLGYLSADIILSEKRTVFRKRSSRKTVSYEEQITSKDKYPRLFSPQMEAIVFIILQIVFATRAVLKIGEYSRISPSFSWGIFGHVTCLDQSRVSENIWWIITAIIIHQIFSLTCDWSNHVTWPNIPQLKLGDIRDYNPSNLFACTRLT